MKKILRIYLSIGAKVNHELGFWQRIWNPNLVSFILKKAKELGVEQAISLNVTAGFLKGKQVAPVFKTTGAYISFSLCLLTIF
jgi:hypothetical protein